MRAIPSMLQPSASVTLMLVAIAPAAMALQRIPFGAEECTVVLLQANESMLACGVCGTCGMIHQYEHPRKI